MLTTQNWLDLNEYSVKYKVSLSTLRRRIRFSEIENFFRDGKYWVPDQKITKNIRAKKTGVQINHEIFSEAKAEPKNESKNEVKNEMTELIGELKSAYVSVLHEKENQITQLKEELVDLKTLVKILESENERLQSQQAFTGIANWHLGEVDL